MVSERWRRVCHMYEGRGMWNSQSETLIPDTPSSALRASLRRTSSSMRLPLPAFRGFCGETTSHTPSSRAALRMCCASEICPVCIGLKEPPYIPILRIDELADDVEDLSLGLFEIVVYHYTVELVGKGHLILRLGKPLFDNFWSIGGTGIKATAQLFY